MAFRYRGLNFDSMLPLVIWSSRSLAETNTLVAVLNVIDT